LKTHQMFSFYTMVEEFRNAALTGTPPLVILDLCLRKTPSRHSHVYRDAIVFEKLRFQNVFRPHENEKPAFSKSSGLECVFGKLRFRDGLARWHGQDILTYTTGLRASRSSQITDSRPEHAATCQY